MLSRQGPAWIAISNNDNIGCGMSNRKTSKKHLHVSAADSWWFGKDSFSSELFHWEDVVILLCSLILVETRFYSKWKTVTHPVFAGTFLLAVFSAFNSWRLQTKHRLSSHLKHRENTAVKTSYSMYAVTIQIYLIFQPVYKLFGNTCEGFTAGELWRFVILQCL